MDALKYYWNYLLNYVKKMQFLDEIAIIACIYLSTKVN